jgi:hypothetical protein
MVRRLGDENRRARGDPKAGGGRQPREPVELAEDDVRAEERWVEIGRSKRLRDERAILQGHTDVHGTLRPWVDHRSQRGSAAGARRKFFGIGEEPDHAGGV